MLENAYNFRDVGGLRTVDGRRVRPGRLYRSDALHRVNAADLTTLGALGIRTVIDLRRPYEITAAGRLPEISGVAWHNIHPNHREWEFDGYDETAGAARYLADRYLDMVAEGATGLAQAVRLIADPEAAPVVVHCMAGKDRTGVLVALTLALLDVAEADIATDYAYSGAIQDQITARMRRDSPDVEIPDLPAYVLAAPAQAILLFLAGVRATYGSAARLLAPGGVDADVVAALRTHLLVD